MRSLCVALATLLLAPGLAAACEMALAGGGALAWRMPVADAAVSVSATYGVSRHPILGSDRLHTGVDWSGPVGTMVSAAASGRIAFAGRQGEYGISVLVDHGSGWSTLYAHLNRLAPDIAAGACVHSGSAIGTLGATGLVAGPHLHFEVQRDGVAVDPMGLEQVNP